MNIHSAAASNAGLWFEHTTGISTKNTQQQ